MKRFVVLLILFISAVLVTGFPPTHAEEKKPEAACAVCTMKIEEKARNFSVVMPKTSSMEASDFDDVGCAVVYRNKECASRQSTFDSNAYAHDYESGAQIPLEKAFFVVKSGVQTPMGYAIIAFKSKEQAGKFAAEHGNASVLKWYQVVDLDIK